MEEEQKKAPEVDNNDDANPAGYRFGLEDNKSDAQVADALPGADHSNLPAKEAESTAISVTHESSTTAMAPASGPGSVASATVVGDTGKTELVSSEPAGIAVDSLPKTTRADSTVIQPVLTDGTIAASMQTPPAGEDKFSVDEVIGYAWRAMIKYFWPLTGILASNFLVMSVPTAAVMVLNYTANSGLPQTLSMLLSLCSIVLNQAIALGTVTVWLKICDGDTISTRDVYSKFGRVWKFMAATFLYWSMVIIGYLCFILPGIYLQLRFQFFPYFISDSSAGPIQALKASHAITKGCMAELFFLSIVTWFIGWVGMLILLVGIFPAQAIQNIALARTYRQLLKNTPEADLPINMPPPPVIAEAI